MDPIFWSSRGAYSAQTRQTPDQTAAGAVPTVA